MSIGVIVLIVVLFTINLCIGIKRYWTNVRCARAASQGSAAPCADQEQNLRHVLFVNPGGSFQIGKRLKKDTEIAETDVLPPIQPVETIDMVNQPPLDPSIRNQDQEGHMVISIAPTEVAAPVVPSVT